MAREKEFMRWLKRLATARRIVDENRDFPTDRADLPIRCLDYTGDAQGGVFLCPHGKITDLTDLLNACGISWQLERGFYDDGSAKLSFTAYEQPFFAIADMEDMSWQI